MKSNNEIAERNRKLGLVSLEDVEELYDELLSWDKKDFIEKHMWDEEVGLEQQQQETYNFEDVYEFCRDHDEDDILDEIGDDSCFSYLRDQWCFTEFIDALKDHGRSWATGYTDEDFINVLDFSELKKEVQVKLLSKLDRSVIEDYLKETK